MAVVIFFLSCAVESGSSNQKASFDSRKLEESTRLLSFWIKAFANSMRFLTKLRKLNWKIVSESSQFGFVKPIKKDYFSLLTHLINLHDAMPTILYSYLQDSNTLLVSFYTILSQTNILYLTSTNSTTKISKSSNRKKEILAVLKYCSFGEYILQFCSICLTKQKDFLDII